MNELENIDVDLPFPTFALAFGDVSLRCEQIVPAEPNTELVPYYHFRILIAEQIDVGHINFRVGNTNHVQFFAGHIGFQIREEFRGRRYARQACKALVPWIKNFYQEVIITCDPDNIASRCTIEGLRAKYIDELIVAGPSIGDETLRVKRRYLWELGEQFGDRCE